LKSKLPGKVPWNFEKYLVDKNGTPVSKLGDSSPATDLEAAITKLLAA
jgi:glutathione peroxidase-family protein